MPEKNKINFRIWFYTDDKKFFGKGRIELLERIDKTGSISDAAKEMKMSYRQAWQMIQEMNKRSKISLVEKQLGGKNGGGTIVTEAGKKAIKNFHKLESKVTAFIKQESENLIF